MQKIVENIKELAKQQRLSIRQLEIAAEVSNGAIARWDKKPPSIDKVYRVANVLGCTVDDLISASERIDAEANARMEPEPKTGSEIGNEIIDEMRKPQPSAAYFRSVAQ